jgi:dTDP-4-dehydrorhamnose 3,5-epimerase-like enzyme
MGTSMSSIHPRSKSPIKRNSLARSAMSDGVGASTNGKVVVMRREPAFSDTRGEITDILGGEPVRHVSIISTVAGAVRGNHFHRLSSQYTFVVSGKVRFFTRYRDKAPVETVTLRRNDLIFVPRGVQHTMLSVGDSTILALTSEARTSATYEADTFRVKVPLEQAQPTGSVENRVSNGPRCRSKDKSRGLRPALS